MRRSIRSLQASAPACPNEIYTDSPGYQAADPLLRSFVLTLEAEGRSPKTVTTYTEAVHLLERFRNDRGMPALAALTAEHLREFLADLRKRGNRPATVACRYRALKRFYGWLREEGERQDSPFDRIKPPRIPDQTLPHYVREDITRLLGACKGRAFLDLRDRGAILVLLDTGVRAGELIGMRIADINWRERSILVRGKGAKEREVAISPTTAQALDRYLRLRALESPWVWTSQRDGSRLTVNALRMALARRCKQAGVQFRGIHAWRRTSGIMFLDAGGESEDLRNLMGWSSYQMLARYVKATAGERARKAHATFSPVQNLVRS